MNIRQINEELAQVLNEGKGETVYILIDKKVTPLYLEVLSAETLIKYAKDRVTDFS